MFIRNGLNETQGAVMPTFTHYNNTGYKLLERAPIDGYANEKISQ